MNVNFNFENGQDLKLTSIDLWEKVNLPHTFNKDDMQKDRNFYTGTVVYQKKLKLAPEQANKRIYLNVEIQNNIHPGYSLVTRGIAYVLRILTT